MNERRAGKSTRHKTRISLAQRIDGRTGLAPALAVFRAGSMTFKRHLPGVLPIGVRRHFPRQPGLEPLVKRRRFQGIDAIASVIIIEPHGAFWLSAINARIDRAPPFADMEQFFWQDGGCMLRVVNSIT